MSCASEQVAVGLSGMAATKLTVVVLPTANGSCIFSGLCNGQADPPDTKIYKERKENKNISEKKTMILCALST